MRNTSPKEARTLITYFDKLKELKIRAIILRNYEGFPHSIGNDLDVYIPKEHASEAARLLVEIVISQGGVLSHAHCRSYFKALFLKLPDSDDILHVDVYHGALTWHGIPFQNERLFVQRSQPMGNASIPSPPDEVGSLLLTSLLWGGFFKEPYRRRIQDLLATSSHRNETEKQLSRTFGIKSKTLIEEVITNQKIDGHKWRNDLRTRLALKSIRDHPIKAATSWLSYWFYEFGLLLSPPGVEIRLYSDDEETGALLAENAKNELAALFGDVLVLTAPVSVSRKQNSDQRQSKVRYIFKKARALSKNMLVIETHPLGNSGQSGNTIPPKMEVRYRGRISDFSEETFSPNATFYSSLTQLGVFENDDYRRIPWKSRGGKVRT